MSSVTHLTSLQSLFTFRSDRKVSISEAQDPSGSNPTDPSEAMKQKRQNILSELLTTESNYVKDLESVLEHYRDKLTVSNLPETMHRAEIIFGNLDEIHAFHSTCLYPELERCGANPASVAKTFIAECQEIKLLYSNYCQNMNPARQAIQELGGEQNPGSILSLCQQEAGHQVRIHDVRLVIKYAKTLFNTFSYH